MIVYPLGPVRQGGGTLIVCVATPNVAVTWELVGNGTLTPTSDRANAAGVASAVYSAVGAQAGDSVTVRATAHA